MKSIFKVLNENYNEALDILKVQPNQTVTFALWNENDGCYYPNDGIKHDEWYDTSDVCPWVDIEDIKTGVVDSYVVTEARYIDDGIEFKASESPDQKGDGEWYDLYCAHGVSYWSVLEAIGEWTKKVYVVTQESCVDGEIITNAVPCATMEAAKQVMKEEIETIVNESPKYRGLDLNNPTDEYEVDIEETSVNINLPYDDYYERFRIDEKTLIS